MRTRTSAKPFLHAVIDGFLPTQALAAAKRHVRSLPFERKESDLFSLEQTRSLADDPALAGVRDALKTLPVLERFQVKPKRMDLHAMRYTKGDHLLPHDDRLEGRRVAFILYLTEADGGDLALIEDKKPYRKKRVQAKPNRVVLFKVSAKSWHEVEEVRGKERLSLGGWLH